MTATMRRSLPEQRRQSMLQRSAGRHCGKATLVHAGSSATDGAPVWPRPKLSVADGQRSTALKCPSRRAGQMSIWMRVCATILLIGGLAVSGVGSATCSATAAGSELQRDDTGGTVDGLRTTTDAADVTPTRTPAAARGATSPAPRARWHRYLPGMFK
jgi:hypothetical protein